MQFIIVVSMIKKCKKMRGASSSKLCSMYFITAVGCSSDQLYSYRGENEYFVWYNEINLRRDMKVLIGTTNPSKYKDFLMECSAMMLAYIMKTLI